MECPNCRAENREDSKFCGDCGAPLGPGASGGSSMIPAVRPVDPDL